MNGQTTMLLFHMPGLLFIYLFGLILPYRTRKELVFSTRFPIAFAQSEQIRSLKREYLKQYGVIGGLFCVAITSATLLFPANALFPVAGIFLQLAIITIFFLSFRKKAQTIKNEADVAGGKRQVTIADTEFRKNAPLPSWFWFLIPWAILAANVAIVFLAYERIPDTIPMQYNFNGEVSRWMTKSVRHLLLMPIIMLFTTLLMMAVFWIVKVTKPQISAEIPGKSTYQNARFRFHWAVFVIVLSILMNILFAFSNLKMTALIKTSFEATIIFPAIMVLGILAYALLLSLKVGQGGSRIEAPGEEEETGNINRDDDGFWKAGLFYYNPDDPSLWIEKRFGIGYTINFGNKKSIWCYVVLVVIILFPVIYMKFLAGQ